MSNKDLPISNPKRTEVEKSGGAKARRNKHYGTPKYAIPEILQERGRIEAAIQRKRADLPHLYGYPHYKWSREFFNATDRMCFLTAANQASKSSVQIRKTIDWSTDKSKWKKLWPKSTPKQFWYMYPAADLATTEFEKKWVTEFLPRGAAKNSEEYGWEVEYKKGFVHALHFRSGVTVYFKLYSQKPRNLQASSVHAIFSDEEMPPEFYDEISARLSATEGYFSMVFTATDGHPLWYRTMERIGHEDEAFKGAHKQIVSLYDCLYYEDGSAGGWTIERIKQREADCSSDAEIQRRVMGRFVKESGRKFSQFDGNIHFKPAYVIPTDWRVYAAVDIGSGRKTTIITTKSSGAIVFIAVNPECTKGAVFKIWRGDDLETSAGDILDQYRQMRAGISVVQAAYDHASKEFGIIASRSSENFVMADKSRDVGTQTINTLFKHQMLDILDVDQSAKLVQELMTVPEGEKTSRKIQNDLTDALRYCILLVPWDWSKIKISAQEVLDERDAIKDRPLTEAELEALQIKMRRGEMDYSAVEGWSEFETELDYWNDQYGS